MKFNVKNLSAFCVAALLISTTISADLITDEFNPMDQECTQDEATRGHKKNKQLCNLTVCNKLKAGSLKVKCNETVCGNSTIAGDQNIGGSLMVTGTLTAGSIQSTGFQTIEELIIINPVIAVETGGNILDYAYFNTLSTQAVGAGSPVTLDDIPVNSPGIILGPDMQTITFVNAGVYLLNAYMVGSSDTDNTGFGFSFQNPVGSNPFSGGVTSDGVITTMSGTAVIICPTPGRTMTLNNISGGTFTLSTGGLTVASTAGITIVRLQ